MDNWDKVNRADSELRKKPVEQGIPKDEMVEWIG